MEFQIQPSPLMRTAKSVFPGGVEGEWTPILTFATPGDLVVAYATQFGYFSRIGSFATCYFQVSTITFTHTTASGALRLTNFPFKPRRAGAGGFSFHTGNLEWRGITKATYTDMQPNPIVGDTIVEFRVSGSGVANSLVVAADCPTGGTMFLLGGVTFQTEESS